jgi:hypothetical protein
MTDLTRCIARGCIAQSALDAISASGHGVGRVEDTLDHYMREAEGEAVPSICARLRADMELALRRGDTAHAATLLATLRRFLGERPVSCGA